MVSLCMVEQPRGARLRNQRCPGWATKCTLVAQARYGVGELVAFTLPHF